ncbi:MAG: phosphate signaling complex protein PhoU [Deinococcaceae bacterium]
MRESLQHDLERLQNVSLDMVSRVRQNLALAGQVLLETRSELLAEVIENDRAIDNLEHTLETDCLRIIARYQPVAVDLRMVTSLLKSATDLERMGDYAVHVAEDGALLAQESPLKRYVNLGNMLRGLDNMLLHLEMALRKHDLDLARMAHRMDDEVDDLFEQMQRELITYMIEDPRTIGKAMTLLRVGRSLERIGDHIENVAERMVYWLTGHRFEKSET